MDSTFDKLFYNRGLYIGGVDETGVTDIAGPLVAACVVLPRFDLHRDDLRIFGVNDSKDIPERFRKKYAEIIWETAIAIGIGEATPSEIDCLGRNRANALAMFRSVMACKRVSDKSKLIPNFLMVDGNKTIPTKIKQECVRGGDRKSLCIASASVVAKVYRDNIMIKYHEKYPWYDWERNKGYPCKNQYVGLDNHGIKLGIHRCRVWPISSSPLDKLSKSIDWKARREGWRNVTYRLSIKALEDAACTKKNSDQHSISLNDLITETEV